MTIGTRVSRAVAVFLTLMLFTTGCGTMMYGTQHHLGIVSDPPGAIITIDGKATYSTPVTVVLEKSKNHTVRIELEGYLPLEMEITRKVNWGIAALGIYPFFPSIIIDFITGGVYTLRPDEVQAQLIKENISYGDRTNIFQVLVINEVDPFMKKHASLNKRTK